MTTIAPDVATPLTASTTALVIIDVQVYLIDHDPPPAQTDALLATLADLLARARAADVPVIFVQHMQGPTRAVNPGHPGFAVHPAIAPLPGETLIHKRASDSFYGSDLRATLIDLDISALVIGGIQTEQCVDTTCRSALSHGYDVVLVGDGHTTWDTDSLTAQQIIDHCNVTLPDLAHPDHAVTVRAASEITFGS